MREHSGRICNIDRKPRVLLWCIDDDDDVVGGYNVDCLCNTSAKLTRDKWEYGVAVGCLSLFIFVSRKMCQGTLFISKMEKKSRSLTAILRMAD